jgi:hypothetical protein
VTWRPRGRKAKRRYPRSPFRAGRTTRPVVTMAVMAMLAALVVDRVALRVNQGRPAGAAQPMLRGRSGTGRRRSRGLLRGCRQNYRWAGWNLRSHPCSPSSRRTPNGRENPSNAAGTTTAGRRGGPRSHRRNRPGSGPSGPAVRASVRVVVVRAAARHGRQHQPEAPKAAPDRPTPCQALLTTS